MLRPTFRFSVLTLAALVLVAAPLSARNRKAPTTPGTYHDWGGEIDRVEVIATFRLGDYDLVVVEPLDGSHTELPDTDDNTYAPVKSVLLHATSPYAAGLAATIGERIEIVEASREETGPGKKLILRGKIEQMDPGSQAARYWAGFGAGAARTEISGELFDPESGKVLLKFDQERRSAVGDFGGDYEELMDRNLEQIGGDIAMLLGAF
ncbi:MAG TPA: DUF4410 domain-containing protein [Thermoanaerobaculia bacterium]|jgi:hypothetical protein|nr:DUF4410 domain-containing protein [Thermoanaerobaculia bacterium]